ncbi:hypothetical protein TNCV_2127981 [Trichonephila clavipes]|nr:hypothetical protein TNCV_2127981 [Trichonephila clavipes]
MHVKYVETQTSSRWCGVVVWRMGCQLQGRPRYLTKVENDKVRHRKPSNCIIMRHYCNFIFLSFFKVAAVAESSRYRIMAGLATSSSPVPLKIRRGGQRCTLNLLRAEISSRWCGVVVRRGR